MAKPSPCHVEAEISVRVQPRASQDRITRDEDGRWKVYVTAAPAGGEANAAVRAVLARALGIAKGKVTIVRGETSRTKQVRVADMPEVDVQQRLRIALER